MVKPKKLKETKLLYRKTKDGSSYEKFHKLCDKQGATIVLIKSTEDLIFGGYTPLNWDSNSAVKNEEETFLFSLTNNKKYEKVKKSYNSIVCRKDIGPFFPYIGFRGVGIKNMDQGDFQYSETEYFKGVNEIIPNEGINRTFETKEVEIYKIIFN